MKLVSVILPLYNSQEFISETIKSVQAQSHSNFELIVIDDCSSDESAAVAARAAELDDRIKCFSTRQNSGGPAMPRNQGLQRVRGDYVAFIDSDDIWHPEKLEYQLNAMDRFGLEFSSTRMGTFHTSPDEANLPDKLGTRASPEPLSHEKLLRKNIVANSSVLLTKRLAKELDFSIREDHVAVEDYLAWLKLHQNQTFASALLPIKTFYYRSRQGSLSRSKLQMAVKIFRLLSEYQVEGRGLGLKKYYYFATYMINSIK